MEKIIFYIDVNNAFLSWTAVDLMRKDKNEIDIRTIPSIIGGDESKRHIENIPTHYIDFINYIQIMLQDIQ